MPVFLKLGAHLFRDTCSSSSSSSAAAENGKEILVWHRRSPDKGNLPRSLIEKQANKTSNVLVSAGYKKN